MEDSDRGRRCFVESGKYAGDDELAPWAAPADSNVILV